MSTAPQVHKDLKRFLSQQLSVDPKNFSITSACGTRRVWGYHLGKKEIMSECGMKFKDYSLDFARDKNGLSNASAGFDIRLRPPLLKKLRAFLVGKASSGRVRLYREVIGPDDNGNAKRWARETKWKASDGRDDHEWHIHIGFYRDTEFVSKIELFREWLKLEGLYDPSKDEFLADEEEPVDPPLEPEGPNEPARPEEPEQPIVDPKDVLIAEYEDAIDAIEDIIAELRTTNPD